MKKVLYILAVCLPFAFAGCSYEKDLDIDLNGGKGLEFVHFESPTYAWLVTADDKSYDFEVVVGCTQEHETDVTYNISIGDNTTGVEGKDFSIPVKSVTIKAGEYIGTIPVKVLYDTTGEGFDTELLLSVDEGLINDAYGDATLITVKSDKITIDWNWLEGKWTALDQSGGDPYVMTITKVDETHATFNNIWGMESDMEGTVDFTTRTVAFKGPINLGALYGGSLMCAHYNETTKEYDDGEFFATMSPLGITITGMGYYLSGGGYDGYDFGTDTTVLTR